MRRLVDTSVWIDYFSVRGTRPLPVLDALDSWIRDSEVVMLLPILSELRSGSIKSRLSVLLEQLDRADLDWNDPRVWSEIAGLGRRFAGIGIVDRMILLAALEQSHQVVTFDRNLARAAHALGVGLK